MKKLISIILVLVLALGLVACSGKKKDASDTAKDDPAQQEAGKADAGKAEEKKAGDKKAEAGKAEEKKADDKKAKAAKSPDGKYVLGTVLKFNNYEYTIKDARVVEDVDGSNALVIDVHFVNNTKEDASPVSSALTTFTQDAGELEVAAVSGVDEDLKSIALVAAGASSDFSEGYTLKDKSDIKINIVSITGDDEVNIVLAYPGK